MKEADVDKRLVNRFLKYVTFDTQSDHESDTFPTTSKQLILADYIKTELELLGLDNVKRDENGYVTATLQSNTPSCKDVVGFVAHLDTAPDFSGKDVKPMIHTQYDGEYLVINNETIFLIINYIFHITNIRGNTRYATGHCLQN